MSAKTGTDGPKTGTDVHRTPRRRKATIYNAAVASALRNELKHTHHAAKTIMSWTGASERTAKHWLAGTRGPGGDDLIALIRHSDTLMANFLTLCGRQVVLDDDRLRSVRAKIDELQLLVRPLVR